MSFWLEIHCDYLIDGADSLGSPLCWTNKAKIEGVGALNTTQFVLKSRVHLIRAARKTGWVKTKRGWACPACKGAKP